MDNLKKIESVPLRDVRINDSFWSKHIKLVHDVVIPYQWEAINDRIPDAEPSHCIKNFRIASGLEEGEFYGFVFQDTDLAKWLEAVAYRLETHPDAALEKLADEAIELIEMAQQPDGYLNTYFTVKEPGKRWTNLRECHELYTAGHMIEAAVAYYNATGKKKLLDVMCRFADYACTVFGDEHGKIKGYDGHQEIELALVKLYNATGKKKYLELSKFFLDERGQEPFYFDIESEKRGFTVHFTHQPTQGRPYNQTHLPIRSQETAEGHAVRVVYMCTGIADVAMETGDNELLDVCRKLWTNIISRRMYITGGIGSVSYGEAFSFDYDLPNDTMYTETCASVGLIFFAHRMLKIETKSCYADEMERALYNNVLAGMSQDGRSFFYVNPLEVWPEACEKNVNLKHVMPIRQKWFGCACCPPNVARLLASLGQYIYTIGMKTIYTHLYIGSETSILLDGSKITLTQETNYPWDGKIRIKMSTDSNCEFSIGLRIPGWCSKFDIAVNGKKIDSKDNLTDGYLIIDRLWFDGDIVELDFEMPAVLIQANPKVRADAGKVAIQRGPIVYCLEEIDNGKNLSAISIAADTKFSVNHDSEVLGGMITVTCDAERTSETGWKENLYKPFEINEEKTRIKAVPYCLWGNRGSGEMSVWIRKNK